MKKSLLIISMLLTLASASAQLVRSSAYHPVGPALPEFFETPLVQEDHERLPGDPVMRAPRKATDESVWYRRPAGAFTACTYMQDGVAGGTWYMQYLFMKPFVPYTFTSMTEADHYWSYMQWGYDNDGARAQIWHDVYDCDDLVLSYPWEWDHTPILTAGAFTFQTGGYKMSGTSSEPVTGDFQSGRILSGPNAATMASKPGGDLLFSSKSFCFGGRYGNQRYVTTTLTGATPYGSNESGYWFGKNGGSNYGIAQAFEKPTAPYLLKNVVLKVSSMEVTDNVTMNCKIYKLNSIPAYADTSVVLPEEPGELMYYGRAQLTPTTFSETGGLVVFALYGEEDGLEFEVTPTIEDAIFVAIDGYNEEGMEAIQNFSASISTDGLVDEGYGELAYMKREIKDSEGNPLRRQWNGVNNYFKSGQRMTGISIYLTLDHPFVTFNYNNEDGIYQFPTEGGVMEKFMGQDEDGNDVTTRSIEFYTSVESAYDDWYFTCDGGEVPEWLNIELSDGVDDEGEFNNLVTALVTAEPLPAGVDYREAVVRFEFPGDHIEYTFTQGEKGSALTGDVNGDGEVNIADVNAVIDMILSGNFAATCDVNGDGEVNIADVNAIIDIILK